MANVSDVRQLAHQPIVVRTEGVDVGSGNDNARELI
jgi:hypothetical protein